MTWPCRYCGDRHLETTRDCPALAFDRARLIAATRLRPTAEDRRSLAAARRDWERERAGQADRVPSAAALAEVTARENSRTEP